MLGKKGWIGRERKRGREGEGRKERGEGRREGGGRQREERE